jgi:hypothetical protein
VALFVVLSPMRDPLYGIRLKLDRAKQQIHSLRSELKAFVQSQPYGLIRQYDAELRTLKFLLVMKRPYPGGWGVQVGEIAHNFRSALDHLIWELVIHETGAPPTVTKTQFPIFETEAGYLKRTPEFLHGVGGDAKALIESLQPFRTGEGVRSPLWQLLKLSDFDKHRTLHLAGAKNQAAQLKLSGLTPHMPVEVSTTIGPLEDGAPFLTVHFPGTSQPFPKTPDDVKVKGPLGLGIVFDKGSVAVAGEGVAETLGSVGKRVYENIERVAREVLGLNLKVV